MEGTYFFGEYQRWNLGWSNPNQAGAFIAMWIPWLWGLLRAMDGRRHECLICTLFLALELGLWFLLCKTYSRGDLVGVVLSGVVFLGWRYVIGGGSRRWSWLAVRVAGVVTLLVITGFFNRIDPRFISQDASAGNRLTLWRGGLQMVAASPWHGWGIGNSGPAFMHWFQPQGSNEAYAGMVNSYLHVAVERGLPILVVVITIAMGVLVMAWRTSRAMRGVSSELVAAAGCSWLVFLIVNGFSTLWIFGNLWWIPMVAGLWILGATWAVHRMRVFDSVGNVLGLSAVFSIVVITGLCLAGRMMTDGLRITPGPDDGWVSCAGPGASGRNLFLFPDPTVLGETWGKEIRRLVGELAIRQVYVSTDRRIDRIPSGEDFQPRWIIACGREAGEGFAVIGKFPEAGLILVHPLGKPIVPEGFQGKVSVILPMLDTHGTGRQWKLICRQHGWGCRTSPGVGQDVRLVWPEILVREM